MKRSLHRWFLILLGLALAWGGAVRAQSVCAVVKIEIRQELTFERQAFEAHLRISNDLDTLAIEDLAVDVLFSDENGLPVLASFDPSNTDADFFIRVRSMDGVGAVDGSGSVAPATSADIRWLIVPAPGAGGTAPSGRLYFVGARVSYTLGGDVRETAVTPDYIYVRPLPLLSLDYFLTREVFADDAFTPEIEPPEPFTLGVRIKNNGHAQAQHVRIDSAQPQIVENEQGLLIGFQITGSTVNAEPSTPSLLADFGNIEPNRSAVGRWQMETSLSGEFVDFTAEFSHADELGGELTSIVEATNAHFLVRDVHVDLAGRDAVRDFLAKDGDVLRVYESSGLDTEVFDFSGSASLTYIGDGSPQRRYRLAGPALAGFSYVQLSDPELGQKRITGAVRSDGKSIRSDNVWLSKRRREDNGWDYFVNLFDANGTGSYTLIFDNPPLAPLPPVLQFIPDRQTREGAQIAFLVEASDPNDTVPEIVAAPLPDGASFEQDVGGPGAPSTYVFDWTPAVGQAGLYPITYTASDGVLDTSQTAAIRVCPAADTDCDGMDDAWEQAHFGTLDRDGAGDFDGDGISDLDEFDDNTDPTVGDLPGTPTIVAPALHEEVTELQPSLVIENSTHRPDHTVEYHYEVYADPAMTELAASAAVPETPGTTTWQVQPPLEDNHWYDWRVRAGNGFVFSPWASSDFFVNTENDPPGPFQISSPENGAEVGELTPALEVTNSVDVDEDELRYGFEVYADGELTTLVASVADLPAGASGHTAWSVDPALSENRFYYWLATATDEHGALTATEVGELFVNTYNDPPGVVDLVAPADGVEITATGLDLVVGNAVDPDDAMLDYYFERDTVATFDSTDRRMSGPIDEGTDTTAWSVGGLADNTWHHWRAKASDGFGEGPWTRGSFFVNTENDPPSVPTVSNPDDGSWVETRTPSLELNPATDPDGDTLSYDFELYDTADLGAPLTQAVAGVPEWVVDVVLADNHWYAWSARARDEHGAEGAWTAFAHFFVNENGVDDPPSITVVEPAVDTAVAAGTVLVRWQDADPDSNAAIELYYDTDSSGCDGTLIASGLEEDAAGTGDQYAWNVTGLAPGTYHVHASIADETSETCAYAPGSVTVDAGEGWQGVTDLDIDLAVVRTISGRRTRAWHLRSTVTNTGAGPVTGPLRLVVTSGSLTVLRPDGETDAMEPYYLLPGGEVLEPGESVQFDFRLSGSRRASLSYDVRLEYLP